MTQEQLAERAGVGRITLLRIEKGEQSPKYDTLIALASALNRDPAELFRPGQD
jgi:transcriptional regulator with XRE-family HTH domain